MTKIYPIKDIDSQFLAIDKLRNSVLIGHVLDALKKIPDESIDEVCTSPPYYGVRDYGTKLVIFDEDPNCEHEWKIENSKNINLQAGNPEFQRPWRDEATNTEKNEFAYCKKCLCWEGQLGHEKTPKEFIRHLVQIFKECFRVLKSTGTLWIIIADSYWGGGQSQGHTSESKNFGKTQGKGYVSKPVARGNHTSIKNKSLIGIPGRLKIALIDEGFICRSDIIWKKPNPIPESAKDRFTRDYEHVLFFTKQGKYFFKQQLEPNQTSDDSNWNNWSKKHNHGIGGKKYKESDNSQATEYQEPISHYRNKRTVWEIPVRPYKDAHFAVFPEDLITDPIDAGCPVYICKKCNKPRETTYNFDIDELSEEYNGQATKDYDEANAQNPSDTKRSILESMRKGNPAAVLSNCDCDSGFDRGIVLDPFMGSGTTGKVAKDQGKDFVGIDLQEEYVPLMKKRIGALVKRLDTFF